MYIRFGRCICILVDYTVINVDHLIVVSVKSEKRRKKNLQDEYVGSHSGKE